VNTIYDFKIGFPQSTARGAQAFKLCYNWV